MLAFKEVLKNIFGMQLVFGEFSPRPLTLTFTTFWRDWLDFVAPQISPPQKNMVRV